MKFKLSLIALLMLISNVLWAAQTPHYGFTLIPKYPDPESEHYDIYMDNFMNDVDAEIWNTNQQKLSIDATPPATPVCNMPTTGIETNSDGSAYTWLQMTWGAVSDTDLREYEVRVKKDSETAYLYSYTNNLSAMFRPTVAGATYYIDVRAIDKQGNAGSYCTPVSVVAAQDISAPVVPSGLSLSTGISQDNNGVSYIWLQADWTANTEKDVVSYKLRIKEGVGGAYYYATSSTNTLRFVGLKQGITYYVGVKAIDSSKNESDYSTDVSLVSSADTATPAEPSSLTAQAGFQTIWLTWTKATDNDLDATEIWRSQTNDSSTAVKVGETPGITYADEGLGDNQTYYYWAKSRDWSGNTSGLSPPQYSGVFATTAYIQTVDVASGAIINEKIANATVDLATKVQGLLPNANLAQITDPSKLADGIISAAKMATGLSPIEKVASLPSLPKSNYPEGYTVFLTTDDKLYRSTGSAWTSAVDGNDITVNSITTNHITTGTIQASDIAAGTITGTLIAADTVASNHIISGTIVASDIAVNAITANEIAAGAITADEIAANVIASNHLSTGELITLSAQVKDAIVTNAKISDLSATKINAGSLQSLNWSGTAGSQLNISDGTFYIGGSTNPKLSWNGTTLTVKGNISIESGQTFSCTNCVDGTAVQFNYATSGSEGGNATNTDNVGSQSASSVNTGVSRATTGLNSSGQTTQLVDSTNLPAISSGTSKVVIGNEGIKMFNASSQERVNISTDGTFRFGNASGDNLYWNGSTLVLTGRATIATAADSATTATNATNAGYATSAGSATTATTASSSNDLSCTDCVADTELNNTIDLGAGGVTIRSNNANNRVQLSSSGIYGYNTSGTQTFGIDSSNGNAYFGPAGNQISWDGTTLTVPAANVTGTLSAAYISANNINVGTITGSTIRTSSGNKRIEITQNTNEIRWYDSNGSEISTIGVYSGTDWAFFDSILYPTDIDHPFFGMLMSINGMYRTGIPATTAIYGEVVGHVGGGQVYGGKFIAESTGGSAIGLAASGTNGDLQLGTTTYAGSSIKENNAWRKIAYGIIGSAYGNGTTTPKRGTGFTVTRNSVGNYTITFSNSFASAPIVTGAIETSGGYSFTVNTVGTGSFIVNVVGSDGAFYDKDFNFSALVP